MIYVNCLDIVEVYVLSASNDIFDNSASSYRRTFQILAIEWSNGGYCRSVCFEYVKA